MLSIGIDPNPRINRRLSAKTHLFRLTSDEFFSQYDHPTLVDAQHFSLSFVDGLHLFERTNESKIPVASHPQLSIPLVTAQPLR